MGKKAFVFCAMFIAVLSLTAMPAMAQDKATTKDVYDLIIKAAEVMQSLGEEGLEAFKDPKGEFTYKDTYVLVIDCAAMKMLAHPQSQTDRYRSVQSQRPESGSGQTDSG